MSTTVTYKNLAFQHSLVGDYIRSIFGNKNYKAKNFSGIKTASRPWGWQWRQFPHADSTYDVVYVRQRFSIRNHLNGSRQYIDNVFDPYNPTVHQYERTMDPSGNILPIGTFAYEPNRAAFEANDGLGTFGSVGLFQTAISPTLCPKALSGVSPPGRYTCDVELLEPISLAGAIASVRAKIAEGPDPDYDDPTNTRFYSDNYYTATGLIGTAPDGAAINTIAGNFYPLSIKRPEAIPTDPYLLSSISADQALQDAQTRGYNYVFITARKIGITIFNTRLNNLTIERYCRSEWTRSIDQVNGVTFSAHRGCQMFTNQPGPRPFNIVLELPGEDPEIRTPAYTNSFSTTSGVLSLKGQMVGNEMYFPGYPAAGYPSLQPEGVLPPPGPCCVLT